MRCSTWWIATANDTPVSTPLVLRLRTDRTAMLLLLKNILFTVVVPGTVAVYVPLLVARDRSPASGLLFACALLVLALGAAIYAWCVWDFATFGRGTPAPIDAPKQLVSRGLYRYTRNPMYVGVLTVILGWALMFRAPFLVLYALVVGGCFQVFIIFYEEPHLRREFGSGYDEYCARIGRWLPRL
jgi:protein-S-isoprenylcysteine O-methyltransferase Ste14